MANDFLYGRDIRTSTNGEVRELTGNENVRSALENRLSTSFRSVPFLPNYGVNLKEYQNMPMTAEIRTRIQAEIREQILRDKRVKEIRDIKVRYNSEGLFLIQVFLTLIGTNRALNVEFQV